MASRRNYLYLEKVKSNMVNQFKNEVVNMESIKESENPFDNIIGLENQKKEVLLVTKWFKNSNELKAKGITIPKGIILFGDPGNGKSLFIKEIIKYMKCPVFIFNGNTDNFATEIVDVFNKAKNEKQAIIVIDELDLLIDKENSIIRALQECLDGVESSDNILVLSATNDLYEIPDPLLRNGRLEKIIHISNPTGKDCIELLKKLLNNFKISLPQDFDEESLELSFSGVSCAAVKAIVNDLVLRNGFDNITNEMIHDSICNITNNIKSSEQLYNLDVAIHEAGHAVMAKRYSEYFKIGRLALGFRGGSVAAKEVEKNYWPYEKCIADIQISMAGVIAQKILCGTGSRGCENDLERARNMAYNIINKSGYSSCWETLPDTKFNSTRRESVFKLRKNEHKIEKLLKTCEKDATKYLKKHKEEIKQLGELLLEKKNLKANEVDRIFE